MLGVQVLEVARLELALEVSEALGGEERGREAPAGNGLTERAFPQMGACRLFLSNSGAEAGEAAVKLAQLHAYRRFLANQLRQRYGFEGTPIRVLPRAKGGRKRRD